MRNSNITEGPIIRPLLYFFFPILCGSFFQQLYNTVDALIVGNVLGKEALAAVGGITSTYLNVYVGFFVGLSAGTTVLISQFYGSRDYSKISKTVHTSMGIAIAFGLFLTIVGSLTARDSLIFLKQPQALLNISLEYIYVYFLGLIFLLVYNMGCSILRAAGDSKRPLYFLIVGMVINIILDIVFVKFLAMGIKGAALATVIAQFASAALIVLSLMNSEGPLKFEFKKICIDLEITKKICIVGLPAALESLLYAASNLLIGTKVNDFGIDVIAANTAYGKIDAIYWMTLQAFNISITTFVGQNFGAKRMDRVKKSINYWLMIAIGFSLLFSFVVCMWSPYLLTMFNQDPNVIKIGTDLIYWISPYWFCYAPIAIISGSLVGMGNAYIPTIISGIGLVGVRILWVLFMPNLTVHKLFVIYPISWAAISIIFLFYYYSGIYKHHIRSFA